MFISRELIESRLKIPFMLLHEMQIKGSCLSFHMNSLGKKKNFKLLLFKEILGLAFKVFRLYIPQPGWRVFAQGHMNVTPSETRQRQVWNGQRNRRRQGKAAVSTELSPPSQLCRPRDFHQPLHVVQWWFPHRQSVAAQQ